MEDEFFNNPEPVLRGVAQIFAGEGKAREVAVLTFSTPKILQTGFDQWHTDISYYRLCLYVQINLYLQIQESVEEIEHLITKKIKKFLQSSHSDILSDVKISPHAIDDPEWREKAASWLKGGKVNNQGRVRSDNVAPLTEDGLLFRSSSEIYFYRALKKKGISFAPLPVFIQGGEKYSRIEPDFVLIKDGLALVVEIDGDTVHTETPVEAYNRTIMLDHEGVHIERISASDCSNLKKAEDAVNKIISVIEKRKLLK